MDPRTLIATRIDLHLRQHLGVGVDVHRAVTDELYMRDVLLVCDAMVETRLPLLARQFRVAGRRVVLEAQHRLGQDAGPAQPWAANTSGFGVSQPHPLDAAPPAGRASPWFSLKRWRRA